MDILIKTTIISSRTAKTKEEIRLEEMRQKAEKAALKWDGFVCQKKLKSLMYVDRSLFGDPKKDRLMDELNFENCMCFKINKTIKFLFI